MNGRPVSIVSGAASGIGRHMARALHRAGHRLVLLDIDELGLSRTAELHGIERDGNVLLVPLDVRDAEGWQKVTERTIERFGRIDYLFNIAGYLQPGHSHEQPSEVLERHIDINVKGVMFAVRAVAPTMVAQRHGHIVNVASLAGLSHIPGLSAYCASKHAVRGFSLAIAHELAPHGVFVSALCPDAVETPMLTLQETYPEAAMTFGAGRALSVEQIEQAIFRILRDKPLELILGVPRSGRGFAAQVANMFPSLTKRFAAPIIRAGRAEQQRRSRQAT